VAILDSVRRTPVLFFFAAGLAVAGCGGGNSTEPSAATPTPTPSLDGVWMATPTQNVGDRIWFTVEGNKVVRTLYFTGTCDGFMPLTCYWFAFTSDTPTAIVDQKVTVQVRATSGSAAYTTNVSASFTSSTGGTASAQTFTATSFLCGGALRVFSGLSVTGEQYTLAKTSEAIPNKTTYCQRY
jgi:hypothetical protein